MVTAGRAQPAPTIPHSLPAAARSILVLAAHPHLEHSRVTRQLMRSAAAARAGGPRRGARPVRALPRLPDRRGGRAGARWPTAQLVVWLHPVHWYGMTPLLKLWVDEVLAFGWAYGPGGTALRGKDLWLVASTGGAERPTAPAARTATSSTPSCRPTSRRRAWSACASCRRWCCMARTALGDAEMDAHVQTFASGWPATPTGRRSTTCAPASAAKCRHDDRPPADCMEHGTTWLTTSLIYLAAAVIAVPLARRSAWARSSATWRPASSSGPGACAW